MGPGLSAVLARLEHEQSAIEAVNPGPPEVRIAAVRGRVWRIDIGGERAPYSVDPRRREAVLLAVQSAREARRRGDRLSPESVRVLRAAQLHGLAESLRHVDALPLDPGGWDYMPPESMPSEGVDLRGEPIERLRALLEGESYMANALEQKLEAELRKVEDAIAIGVVDVDTGMVQGVAPAGALPEDVVMQLGDATRRRFEGTEVKEIGAIMDERKRRQTPRFVQWDMWGSPNTIHFGRRLPSAPHLVVMYVFPSSAPVGAVYTAASKALKGIEAACR